MPTPTVWNDNTRTHWEPTADGDTLTVLPGVYSYNLTQSTVYTPNACTITNYGTLINASTSDVEANVFSMGAQRVVSVALNNYGNIVRTGDVFAGGAAIEIQANVRATIFNSGRIEADYNTFGISSEGRTTITNTGTISAHSDVAIALFNRGALTLTNDGAVLGGIFRKYEIAQDIITNRAGGVMTGPISLLGGADTVTNGGVITGTVSLGDGANIFTNTGTITGGATAVTAGGGADTFTNSGEISGDVNLGNGNNVVTNSGAIYGALSTGSGADKIDLSYGLLTGKIVAGLGADAITGTDGRDVIYGDDLASTDTGGGADIINAGGGDDAVYSGYGADVVTGGSGDDVLNGGYGADQLYGNQGDDVLYGNQDNDFVHGGQGNDLLYGGQGADTVNGGVGDDVLYGNLGDDQFVFTAQGFGHDTIADFSRVAGNTDTISFGAGIFASFADLQAHTLQMPTGVLLYDAAGDTVFIVGATTGLLTADMFIIG